MSSESHQSGSASAGQILVGAAAIYFAPFLVILVDELVLKTNWCARHLPGKGNEVFNIVYFPFIHLVKAFLH